MQRDCVSSEQSSNSFIIEDITANLIFSNEKASSQTPGLDWEATNHAQCACTVPICVSEDKEFCVRNLQDRSATSH